MPPFTEKRAQLTHPPISSFLKKKAAALMSFLKTAVWLCYFIGHDYSAAITTVFFLSVGRLAFSKDFY